MRIVAGKLGGRIFEAPRGHRTHPMSEKVRGALFSALGDIKGLTVLDAFAGSGALAFEAVSRGAKHATAIDIDRGAITTVVKSAQELGIEDKIQATRASVVAWLKKNPGKKFDLIFCDPPFDRLQEDSIEKALDHLKDSGIMVLCWPGKGEKPRIRNGKIEKTKQYGDSCLVFYRKIS